jgi:hypothetical protein
MGQAFGGAWVEIASHFHGPQEIEAARLQLANIILDVAKQHGRDPEELKRFAVGAMTLKYRRLRAARALASAETVRQHAIKQSAAAVGRTAGAPVRALEGTPGPPTAPGSDTGELPGPHRTNPSHCDGFSSFRE